MILVYSIVLVVGMSTVLVALMSLIHSSRQTERRTLRSGGAESVFLKRPRRAVAVFFGVAVAGRFGDDSDVGLLAIKHKSPFGG